MGLPLAIGLGLGIQALGNAFGQQNAANQARRDAQNRQNDINSWTLPFLNPQQSSESQRFQTFLNQLQIQGPRSFEARPTTYNPFAASTVDTTRFQNFDLPSWIGTEVRTADPITARLASYTAVDPSMVDGFMDFNRLSDPRAISGSNAGQDALMQLVNGNGGYNSITAQLDPTAGMALTRMLEGNTAFDNSNMFSALQPIEDRTRNEALASLNAQAGSLGRRFGTQTQDRSANLLQKLTEDANLRRQELARTSYEAAQARILQAGELMNTRDSIRNQVAMANQRASVDASGNRIQGASSAAQSGASMYASLLSALAGRNNNIAGLLSSGMDNASRLALGNMEAGAQTSQFNANAQNNASTNNAANFLTAQGQRINNNNAQNTFNMQGAGLQSDALARLASILQFNSRETNAVNTTNANNQLSTDQFNGQQALQAFLANTNAYNTHNNTILGGLQTLMGDANTAQARALQAIGIRAGVPALPGNAGVGATTFGNNMADLGTLLLMMQMNNRPITPAGSPPAPRG